MRRNVAKPSLEGGAMESWPALAPLSRYLETAESPSDRVFFYDSDPAGASAKAVLLVHGLGDEADSWRRLFPLLSGRYRVLAVDLPGFGRSTRKGRTSLALCVEALRLVLHRAELGSVLLVGSSLGAAIVELLAFSEGDRISGLVLLDGGLPSSGKPDAKVLSMALPFFGKRRYNAYRRDHGAAVASLRPYYADYDGLPVEDRAFLAKRVIDRVESDSQRRAYLSLLRSAILSGAMDAGRYARGLATWTKPLVVAWGALDRIMPMEGAEGLIERAPAATKRIIAGSGHLPQQERPEAVADLIEYAAGG